MGYFLVEYIPLDFAGKKQWIRLNREVFMEEKVLYKKWQSSS